MRRVVVLALAGALLVACTSHPVGPARTDSKYEGKARTTAESARSSVETAILVVRAFRDGDAIGTYAGSVLSDEEEGLAGVQGTFASIQPPSARADEVHDELDQLIGDSLEHVREARVAVRRGDGDAAGDLLPDLRRDADGLAAFVEEHGG
jgi:hypothetical protein